MTNGVWYKIKVRSFNDNGFSDSAVLYSVSAAVPSTPTDMPVSDASITNQDIIKVNYGPISATLNGGSPILSYELQMDDGLGGNFTSLVGLLTPSLETTFVVRQGIKGG